MASKKDTKHVRAVESFVRRMEAGKESVEESTDTLSVHEFVTDPATVFVEYGLTLNLGNYESARVSIGVRVPCYTEEIPEAEEWAKKWVEERLSAEVAAIRKSSGKTGKDSF